MRCARPLSRFARVIASAVLVLGTVAATVSVPASPVTAGVTAPFEKRYDKAFYGDFETVGNGVLDCPTGSTEADCRDTQAGNGKLNNNNFVMTNKDMAGLGGFNSSAANVTVPSGATVDYARLYWGGNNGKYGYAGGTTRERCDSSANIAAKPDGSPKSTKVRVKVDGGSTESVSPDVFNDSATSINGPHYYGAEADITSQFKSASGSTPVAVGDVWAPTGLGCVGGWSLTIVYKYTKPDPDTQNMHNFYVYSGLVVQRSKDKPTDIDINGFYAASAADSHASVTAYEGDRSTPGDRFLVNGKNIDEPHTGESKNFFISESHGAVTPNNENNLNIDAKSFDLPRDAIPAGSTSAKLTLETNGDTYVAQQVAFAVPVPDLEVTKTSAPRTVYAGDTVTYTVTVKNISNLDYPGAKFSDDLTDVLDDGEVSSPTASTGTAEFDSPNLHWSGTVAAGATETVTYDVELNDPMTGDGKLLNDVVANGTRPSTCHSGSDDAACGTTQTVEPPDDHNTDEPGDDGSPSSDDRPATDTSPTDTAEPDRHAAPDQLSTTGGNYTEMILIALALVITGVVPLLAMRRRSRKSEE